LGFSGFTAELADGFRASLQRCDSGPFCFSNLRKIWSSVRIDTNQTTVFQWHIGCVIRRVAALIAVEIGEAIMPNSDEIEYPTEATVGNQGLRGFESESRELLAQSLDAADLHRRIAKVAYELYLGRGGAHGHDLDDWFVAERIVFFQLGQKKRKLEAQRLAAVAEAA
jgi:hypothetical protein